MTAEPVARAAEVILTTLGTWEPWHPSGRSESAAIALAAAGLLVSPEAERLIEAAVAWRMPADSHVMSQNARGLIAAVDAFLARPSEPQT